MIRRQIYLVFLFGIIFQIFFSQTNTLSIQEANTNDLKINNSKNTCEPASIDQFPALFFTDEQRRRGGFLVFIALILYSFAAIEIVCDDYFASALEKISYNLNLTPVLFFKKIEKQHISTVFLIGCCRSYVYGISNISFRIFYIHSWRFFCQVGYCL